MSQPDALTEYLNERLRLIAEDDERRPVGVAATQDATGAGALTLVIYNDGSAYCMDSDNGGWSEYEPLPGTRRARELAGANDEAVGNCTACGGPIYHRPGHPGEFDHDCPVHLRKLLTNLRDAVDSDHARTDAPIALDVAAAMDAADLELVHRPSSRRDGQGES